MTAAVNRWLNEGLLPYEDDIREDTPSQHLRHHFLSVMVSSHLSNSFGDTCADDVELNERVYASPGCGGRLVSSWDRNNCPPMFIITDAFGSPDSVTTVMLKSDY